MDGRTPATEALDAMGISYRFFRHPGQVTSLEQAARERGLGVVDEDKIEIIPVETLKDVLDHALVGAKKESLLKKLVIIVPKPSVRRPVPQ